jgi:hypothetical protein
MEHTMRPADELARQIEIVRVDVETTKPSFKRDQLARKLRHLEAAMTADKWAASCELQATK